jgi:hypothetical protein
MTNTQRMNNDEATMDRRETADATMKDNRIRNDDLTRERRFRADRTMNMNRSRNDEATANRREIRDGNQNDALAISLLVLTILTVGAFFIFI